MQHREWNPKAFFKKVSPLVVSLYETHAGLTLERNSGNPNAAYEAWKALPSPQRHRLEAELLPVNDMCSSHARPYLDQLARTIWSGAKPHLVEESRDWSVYDLAMRLFIDAPQDFIKAHQNYAVDMMEHFREYRGKYPIELQASPGTKERMRQAVIEHFRQYAGGARCQVEDFQGEDKFAIFVYHEDEMTPVDQFDDADVLVPVWQRPVVRIAAVFYPETCTLLVKAPRQPQRETLRTLWATIFAGDADYFEDLSKTPKFNFTRLTDPRFRFPTHFADGIPHVCVTRVVAREDDSIVRRLSIDLTAGAPLAEVHRAMVHHRIALDGRFIDGVRLQFEFAGGKGRARSRTISLYKPNSTNLADTKRDRVIRRYLKEWGIDESLSAFSMAPAPVAAAAIR